MMRNGERGTHEQVWKCVRGTHEQVWKCVRGTHDAPRAPMNVAPMGLLRAPNG